MIIMLNDMVFDCLRYEESVCSVARCKPFLAVSGTHGLYVYNISRPLVLRLLWKSEGFDLTFQTTFSPDCKYVATVSVLEKEIEIHTIGAESVIINTHLLVSNKTNDVYALTPLSLAWSKNFLVIGYKGGAIIAYKIKHTAIKKVVEKEVVLVKPPEVRLQGIGDHIDANTTQREGPTKLQGEDSGSRPERYIYFSLPR